ncbi:MAG: Beta-lactamase [Pedosphaera sp.]|nr:Beta-lactamase [Pedosphaera sp.]
MVRQSDERIQSATDHFFTQPLMSPGDNLRLIRQKTEARLREIVRRTRGALGLMVLDLTSDEQFAFNEHCVFPQASAIKIPILMEVYKQAGEGRLKLTDSHRIEKHDKTPGSGVLCELGDGTVQMNLHDLCVLMIVLSENTATNMLIDLVGMETVNQTLQSLGFKQTRLQRRMMDLAAAACGKENLSTPFEAARIMETLHRGEFISRVVCDDILAILKRPKPGAISSALPEGISIAFKPGAIGGVTTEWAIVLVKDRPYVVAVMENYGLDQEASGAIKEISKTLFDYFQRLSHSTPHGVFLPRTHPSV